MRATVNFGSPYKRGVKKLGRSISLDSIDIPGLTLRYIKSSWRQYELCGMFGPVPSSVSVSVHYSFSVLLKTLRDRFLPQFRVEWPTE